MTVHTPPWPPAKLTTYELRDERAELERKLGDDAYVTAQTREAWCQRLRAIKDEQRSRTEAEQRSRPSSVKRETS